MDRPVYPLLRGYLETRLRFSKSFFTIFPFQSNFDVIAGEGTVRYSQKTNSSFSSVYLQDLRTGTIAAVKDIQLLCASALEGRAIEPTK